MFDSKTRYLIFFLFALSSAFSLCQAQSAPSSSPPVMTGPISREPAVEKDGVRVALQTSRPKKNLLKLRVKISNLSDRPVLVSPDAVETSAEGGFVLPTVAASGAAASTWSNTPSTNNAWAAFSKVAALIPFSDPYKIISSTKSLAEYAEKKAGEYSRANQSDNRGLLRELILQPGMATHGFIVYDASSLRAFDYAPNLHIKVTVSGEPFEFQFASQPASSKEST